MSNPSFKLDDNAPTVSWAESRSGGEGDSSASQVKALYIKNLPRDITQERLKALFEHHGKILKVVIPPAKPGKEDSRYGFVHYAERTSVMRALKNTERYEIDASAYSQPLMHAGGHAAGGMSMMPIMLPDGRIRYVLQQPGLAAMPQPPPRPSPPYRGGSGSSSSKQSSDNGRGRSLAFHLFRFQDQTNLFNFKPSEFKKALEEAVLAENGVDGNCVDAEISSPDSSATESDQDYGPASRFQAPSASGDILSVLRHEGIYTYCIGMDGSCHEDIRTRDACGSVMPLKSLKRTKDSQPEELLCKYCSKLRKSNQYCGICKRIWHPPDDRDWVCCDGCNVWDGFMLNATTLRMSALSTTITIALIVKSNMSLRQQY
ncbi:unnamed protein product [Arabidopsis thaliana]|uniref:RRM domain-containing protein n=2 Tax=Arabidopsis thaliana TaxID=3702 RepID=A0A654G4Z1_ARATH|nr:unnamed protein product [Arabidopsis thaliana]